MDAFAYTSSLRRLELPPTEVECSMGSFYKTGLETLDIPEGFTFLNGFWKAENLKTINGMNHVKKLGMRALSECVSLENLDLSTIEEADVEALAGVRLPAELTLPSLRRIINASNYHTRGLLDSCGVKILRLPVCDTISARVITDDETLTTVEAPNLRHISGYAFNNAKALKDFDWDSLESISTEAFAGCVALPKRLVLPSARIVNGNAFQGCRFEEVILPEAEVVGGFMGCGNLRTVEMPKAVELDREAFAYCKSMQKEAVSYPGIRKIGRNAFAGWDIHEANFPDVEDLGQFSNMPELRKVSCPKVKIIHGFSKCPQLAEIDYLQAEEFGNFCFAETSLVLPEELTLPNARVMGNYVFYGLKGPRRIILPAVESIDHTFTGMNELTDIVLGPKANVCNSNARPVLNMQDIRLWLTNPAPMDINSLTLSMGYNGNPNKLTIYIPSGSKKKYLDYHDYYKSLDIRELTPCGLLVNDISAKPSLDFADIEISGEIKYAEEKTLDIPELFRKMNEGNAKLDSTPCIAWESTGGKSGRTETTAADGHFFARAEGLEPETTYRYTWLDSDGSTGIWNTFTTAAWPDDLDYTDGWFLLNEGRYGSDQGSIAFYSNKDKRFYWHAYRHNNPGLRFGDTSQSATIFNGNLLVMNKQSVAGSGILTIADAKTLAHKASVDFDGADGRDVIGYTSGKAFVSTTDGVYPVDIATGKALPKIKGTDNSTSSHYAGQTGDMAIAGNRLFVAAQGRGVMVIDASENSLITTLDIPDTDGVFSTANGSVYAVTGNNMAQFVKIDPSDLSMTTTGYDSEGRQSTFSWGSWRKYPLAVSPQSETVYFVEETPDYSGLLTSAYSVASFDLETGEYNPNAISIQSLGTTLDDGSIELTYIYGTGLGFEPGTANLQLFTSPGAKIAKGRFIGGGWNYKRWSVKSYVCGNEGKLEYLGESAPKDSYWFPAMVVSRGKDHGTDGISAIASDQKAVKEVRWFAPDGTRLAAPVNGSLNIKTYIFTDGTSRSEKVFKSER